MFSWTLDLSLGVLFSLLFCNSSFYAILSHFGSHFSSFVMSLLVKQERGSFPLELDFRGSNFSFPSPTEVLKKSEQSRRSCSAGLGTEVRCPHTPTRSLPRICWYPLLPRSARGQNAPAHTNHSVTTGTTFTEHVFTRVLMTGETAGKSSSLNTLTTNTYFITRNADIRTESNTNWARWFCVLSAHRLQLALLFAAVNLSVVN